MAKAIEKLDLFKTPRSKAETKADVTNQMARSITESEIAKRDAKTARLREARLAREALEADAPVKPVKAKRASKKA